MGPLLECFRTLVHSRAMQDMGYKDLIMELVWLIKVGVKVSISPGPGMKYHASISPHKMAESTY